MKGLNFPNQLRNDSFRFCKIRAKNKAPYEKAWTKNGYAHDSEELQKHLQAGGNYGVIGGYGNLRMLDIDDEALADELGEQINTFQVRTGSGGRHLYFISTYETNHVLKDDLGEFRAHNYQCVGPGSTHPNGKQYVVHKDEPIKELTEQEVSELLAPYLREETTNVTNVTTALELSDQEIITKCERAKNKHKFNALYAGSTTGYSSHSEADMALCMMFAFYTQDHAQIDRLFRSSGLYREKWEREDYRERTISSAINKARKPRQNIDDYIKEIKSYKIKRIRELNEECEETSDPEELQEIALEAYDLTATKLAHFAAAKRIVNKHSLFTDTVTDKIHVYDKGFYQPIGIEILKNDITKDYGKYATKHAQSEILNHVRNLTYKTPDEVDETIPKHLIPFKNGIYDTEKETLLPHNPQHLFYYQIPHKYKKGATCERVDEFIRSVFDKKKISLFYDIAGLVLTRQIPLQKMFIFWGEGSNGKGEAQKILIFLVGAENTSSVTIQQISEDRFAVASTYRKLLNVAGDIGSKPIKDAGILKQYTGGDPLSGQFKHGQIFDFIPFATLVASANNPPQFYDDSKGLYRRLELVLFPNQFGNEQDVAENPEIQLADNAVLKRVLVEDEMSGLINKALRHLKRINQRTQLSIVTSTNELRRAYKRASNSAEAFLQECCAPATYIPPSKTTIDGKSVFVPGSGYSVFAELYEQYLSFCKQEGLSPFPSNTFTSKIKNIPEWDIVTGTKDHHHCWDANSRVRTLRGVVFYKLPRGQTQPGTADPANTTATPTMILSEDKGAIRSAGSAGSAVPEEMLAQELDEKGEYEGEPSL